MKTLLILILVSVLSFPNTSFGQAPNLGTVSSFALYTAAGAISNSGTTKITGDIGTNAGAFSGSPTIVGETHVVDSVSALAAVDIDSVYQYLGRAACDSTIGTTLGDSQVLTPNVYCLTAASILKGNLILDGQGDSNAVFIFKVNGPLTTSSISNVILKNSAKVWNVYWHINGALKLGDSSFFRGTAVVNGAITLLDKASLIGRGLSTAGAISMNNNIVILGIKPGDALPVMLVSFNAKECSARTCVNFSWQTASEFNSDYFIIERSTDGINFLNIGKRSAAGYSTLLLSYSFTDDNPAPGTNYYRLNQFDFNGMHEYSPVRAVFYSGNSVVISVYPNPFSTSININIYNTSQTVKYGFDNYRMEIYNALGDEVMNTGITKQISNFETSGLPLGIYFYHIIENNRSIQSGRLISQ